MSHGASGAASGRALAGLAAAAVGAGAWLAVAGVLAGDLVWGLAGAAAAGAGLLLLMSARWLDPLPVLALSLPLPALYSTGQARLAPVLFVTCAVCVAWLADRGVSRRAVRLAALPWSALGLLALALVVSAGFAAERAAAARELANMGLFLAVLVAATDWMSGGEQRPEALARALGWAAALAGLFAVLEAAGAVPGRFALAGTPFHRAAGGFGWPNELAMFLAISLPFCVHAWVSATSTPQRAAGAALSAACALGLLATFSRGSWIAVLLAPVALVVAGRARLALTFWLAAAVAVVAIDLASGGAIVDRVARTVSDPLVGQRFLLTRAGVVMLLAHPFVGVGPGNFADALDRFGLQFTGLFEFVGSAHNTYVHMAAETGLLGALALVGVVGAILATMLRSCRSGEAGRSEGRLPLRTAVFWSFTTAALVAGAEWIFAHGIGQLVMLVAALGVSLARRRA